MNKGVTVVGAVGLGAALMYLFDPDRGRSRRALIRDKVGAAGNTLSDKAEKLGHDLSNRASGMVAEAKSILRHEDVSDDVLVDRVRSRLGRIPVDMGLLDVSAENGVVALKGQILESELPRVLRAARFVRGVKAINNQFETHRGPSAGAAIQGKPEPGDPLDLPALEGSSTL